MDFILNYFDGARKMENLNGATVKCIWQRKASHKIHSCYTFSFSALELFMFRVDLVFEGKRVGFSVWVCLCSLFGSYCFHYDSFEWFREVCFVVEGCFFYIRRLNFHHFLRREVLDLLGIPAMISSLIWSLFFTFCDSRLFILCPELSWFLLYNSIPCFDPFFTLEVTLVVILFITLHSFKCWVKLGIVSETFFLRSFHKQACNDQLSRGYRSV